MNERLDENSHTRLKKRITTGVGWLFWEKVFQLSISFFVSVLIARYLGVEKIGIINFLTTIYLLLMPIQSLGMDKIAIDLIVSKSNETGKILGTTYIVKLIFGVVAFSFGVLYLLLFEKELVYFGVIFFLSLIIRSLESIDFHFQANIYNFKSVIAKNIAFGLRSVIAVIFIQLKLPFEYFIYLMLIETIIYILGLVVAYKLENNKIIWSFDKSFVKEIVKKSFPLFLSNILIAILLRSDQLFISYYLGYKANGLYSVAVKFSEILNFIPLAFTTIMLPVISSSIKENILELKRDIFKMYFSVIVSSVLIAIFISIFGNLLINFFYGTQFIESGSILRILVWSSVFSVIGSANGVVFITGKKAELSLYSTLIGSIMVLILNFLLIPKFGIIGGAFSTLISYIAGSVLIFIVSKEARKMLSVNKYGKQI